MFTGIAVVFFLLAIVAVYFGGKILAKFSWVIGWLRGTVGIAIIGLAIFFIFLALDLTSYQQILNDKTILTISFTQSEEQRYTAVVSYIDGTTDQSFDVYGDQWQIDARVIRWKGLFAMFGLKPGYRLDRITGRYYSLEDERRKSRSVHQLTESKYGLDMWQWVQENGGFLPLFDAVYGSATYLPMQNDAIYQVSLSESGLVATPMNDIAKESVNQWR
ncbi:MAG: multidrug transporter [Agarilytica sp.]